MRLRTSLALAGALLVSSFVLIGCGDDAADDGVDTTTAGVETATPPAPADTAGAPAGEERTYTFKGTVTKVDRERNRLTLNHEKIGDWMDAMTMPFPVAEPAMLDQVEEGKAYTFTIAVMPDATYKLTSVTP